MERKCQRLRAQDTGAIIQKETEITKNMPAVVGREGREMGANTLEDEGRNQDVYE